MHVRASGPNAGPGTIEGNRIMAEKKSTGSVAFTEEERAAMKEHSEELKTAARRSPKTAKADGLQDVLDKIAEMDDADRAIAERVHAIVTAEAPELEPRTWYGQPAYALKGKVLVFFQAASKFKTRYATLGFTDVAKLDDGTMWSSAFAITALTDADEARIAELVRRAAA